MRYEEKFRLGLAAIRDLQPYLRASDRMSLMVYAGEPRILGESLPAAVLPALLLGLDTLRPSGQTAGNRAIREAVALAHRNWIDGGNNQLVLITDGAFALGKNEQALFDRSGQGSGLFCSVVATKPDRADIGALDELAEVGKGNLMVVRSLVDAEGMLLLEVQKQSSRRGLWKTGE
jgi:Ca-activated chloride channel family protein